jgi:hypothetical protein
MRWIAPTPDAARAGAPVRDMARCGAVARVAAAYAEHFDAGLNIVNATYDLLFTMTEAGRIDYFLRGVVAAYRELRARKDAFPDLTVETHLLLLYRSDFFFYTGKRSERLAENRSEILDKRLKLSALHSVSRDRLTWRG